MASTQNAAPGHMLKSRSIDEPIFLAVTWTMLSLAFLAMVTRVFIKYRSFSKLSWDDGLVVFAFLFALGTAVTMQVTSKYMYQLEYVRVGIIYPPPASFMHDTGKYFKGTIAQGVFFYCSLWCVKFAFLTFFWRLINKVQGLRYLWCAVAAFAVLSLGAAFGATDWRCISSPVEVIFATCGTQSAGVRMRFQMWFVCAVDVLSDILIITVPFVLLWQVKLPWRKRLGLAAIFSLACVTMAISFVRASMITTYKGQPDNSRTTLWSFVEQTIAIIMVCLGSLRALFTQEQHKKQSVGQYQHYAREQSGASSAKRGKDLLDHTTFTTVDIEADPTNVKGWRPSDLESGCASTVTSEK